MTPLFEGRPEHICAMYFLSNFPHPKKGLTEYYVKRVAYTCKENNKANYIFSEIMFCLTACSSSSDKFHVHQCQAQKSLEIWPSTDFHLTFTWCLTTWPTSQQYNIYVIFLGVVPSFRLSHEDTWPFYLYWWYMHESFVV